MVQGHDTRLPRSGRNRRLHEHLSATGFDLLIREWIAADKPFFGICLGLQALFDHSEEGDTPALGIFPGKVRRFQLPRDFKIPHMGWNHATFADGARLQDELSASEQFYFVHSYYVDQPDDSLNWLRSEYGGQLFTSGISRGNCFATRFHPEKSQEKDCRSTATLLQTFKMYQDWPDLFIWSAVPINSSILSPVISRMP